MKTIEYVINPIFLEEVHSDLIKIDVKQAFVMGQDLFLKKKKKRIGFNTIERNRDLLLREGTWFFQERGPFHLHSGA